MILVQSTVDLKRSPYYYKVQLKTSTTAHIFSRDPQQKVSGTSQTKADPCECTEYNFMRYICHELIYDAPYMERESLIYLSSAKPLEIDIYLNPPPGVN